MTGCILIGLIQRVLRAQVVIGESTHSSIGPGILVLIGIQRSDTNEIGRKLLRKIRHFRIFADEAGKMNLNLEQIGGELMLVPQFTLAADTNSGLRASFSHAADPELARTLYADLVSAALAEHPGAVSGVFGAIMQVSSTNDGPVTYWLEV